MLYVLRLKISVVEITTECQCRTLHAEAPKQHKFNIRSLVCLYRIVFHSLCAIRSSDLICLMFQLICLLHSKRIEEKNAKCESSEEESKRREMKRNETKRIRSIGDFVLCSMRFRVCLGIWLFVFVNQPPHRHKSTNHT